MSGRLCALLTLLLVLSSLSLVKSQYQARQLFMQLETAQNTARRLDTEWSQLQLDQSNLGLHSRVEARARKDLGMVALSSDRTQYVKVGEK
ncbi:MAG: cell division protein FtsL [Pseudomonadota bacterium]|jgi:cell division protein FtsL